MVGCCLAKVRGGGKEGIGLVLKIFDLFPTAGSRGGGVRSKRLGVG